jgi:hypothetical protein
LPAAPVARSRLSPIPTPRRRSGASRRRRGSSSRLPAA